MYIVKTVNGLVWAKPPKSLGYGFYPFDANYRIAKFETLRKAELVAKRVRSRGENPRAEKTS